jgi:regulator of sigma E protease
VAFLLGIGVILPIVHVFGHYLAARLVGVRVLAVSLGFGRKVVKVRAGDTEYGVGMLPVGCFIRMAGESKNEPGTGAPDDFLSKTKWQRLLILLGGSMMNILVAVIVIAFTRVGHHPIVTFPDVSPVVGRVAVGSPADLAGLQTGDRIVEVDNEPIDTWRELDLAVRLSVRNTIRVTYERAGNRHAESIDVSQDRDPTSIGIEPDLYPVVVQATPGEPAAAAGIQAGDVVRAVDGVRMVFPEELRDAVARKAGGDVDLTIARNGVEQHIRVTPIAREGSGRIGVLPGLPTKDEWVGPLDALRQSLLVNYGIARSIIRTLLHPLAPRPPLQGPIRIAPVTAPPSFLMSLLSLVAILSSYVGVLNLLPVPIICDGGRIISMLIWPVRRRQETIGT